MNRTALALALAACGLPAAPDALAAGPAAPRTLALHCERVFDARSGKVLGEHTVLVRDGRIADKIDPLLAGLRSPAAAEAAAPTH